MAKIKKTYEPKDKKGYGRFERKIRQAISNDELTLILNEAENYFVGENGKNHDDYDRILYKVLGKRNRLK